ncbi:MAG: alpha-amylase, partial [Muribaculaceae bacterium]|nr:alpha-amylase [Muribaculaceae bacterium]
MKPVIYQLLPRLFSNLNPSPVPCGTIEQNGCGKFSGVTSSALRAIRSLGATHVWFTGVIEHAHCPDYSAFGIRPDNPHVIKGQAGSPYAITDYYDVDPDLADNPAKRMEEFEAMIARTHRQGLKAIIDFVPNHVAREYHSDAAPRGVRDLGADDRQEL